MNNIKQQAYQLHLSGLSYKKVGRKLNISKTTAFEYIKEMRLLNRESHIKPVQNSSESVPNAHFKTTNKVDSEKKIPINDIPKKVKEFTGDDIIKKRFDSLEFEGKFLELIGKPSKLFSGIIWGLPKGGKSNFSLRFADYLQEYFGNVVYVAAEEGESVTLQGKFKEIGGSKVTVIETRDRNAIREYLLSKDYNFVFIDSINNAGIDSDFLELLKDENPKKSFIAIVQATKGGTFKGDQALTHNCDFIIKVIEGIAYHEGRFGNTSQVKIFEEPLYKKNKNKVEHKKNNCLINNVPIPTPKSDEIKPSDKHEFKLIPIENPLFINPENVISLGAINNIPPVLKTSLPAINPIVFEFINLLDDKEVKKLLWNTAKVVGGVVIIHWLFFSK